MSVARFIADHRTFYRVPHTVTCVLLGVSLSWFYKWLTRTPTLLEQRRARVDATVAAAFNPGHGEVVVVGDVPADGLRAGVHALIGQFLAEPHDQVHDLRSGRVRVGGGPSRAGLEDGLALAGGSGPAAHRATRLRRRRSRRLHGQDGSRQSRR